MNKLKNKKIIVTMNSIEECREIANILSKNGYKWCNDISFNEHNSILPWRNYGKKGCFVINSNGITYSNIYEFNGKHSYTKMDISRFKTLMNPSRLLFTKSERKDY